MKTALIILDGFGISGDQKTNPVFYSKTPFLDFLISYNPHLLIEAAQESVGLSWGEPGNSEVGHFNLGTGQLNWQTKEIINQKIQSGEFFKNPSFLKAIQWVKTQNSKLHLIGLVSSGNVHASTEHLLALLNLAKKQGLREDQVFIQAFTDGRDTPPKVANKYFMWLKKETKKIGLGQMASISGRYYAMDRDNHWDRTLLAYQAIIGEKGEQARNEQEAIQQAYERGESDEFIKPTIIVNDIGKPKGNVSNKDGLILFNFRSDRARQMIKAFLSDESSIPPRKRVKDLFFTTMTPYETDWKLKVEVAFWPPVPPITLSSMISKAGLFQLHLAETEKYAHVTYFFNGGEKRIHKGEKQVLVPSPNIPTYDQKPEMSAFEIARTLKQEINDLQYDFIVLNFANGDMVGHTGNYQAVIKAIEALDQNLADIIPFLFAKNYKIYITSDHGNCEQTINPTTNEIDKEHTVNPVLFLKIEQISNEINFVKFNPSLHNNLWLKLNMGSKKGILADVSASIAKSLDLKTDFFIGESIL